MATPSPGDPQIDQDAHKLLDQIEASMDESRFPTNCSLALLDRFYEVGKAMVELAYEKKPGRQAQCGYVTMQAHMQVKDRLTELEQAIDTIQKLSAPRPA